MMTFAWPLAWICGCGFSIGLSKRDEVDERAKALVFGVLAALCAAASMRAYAEAHDVLRCWVVWCYRVESPDSKPAYKVTVGLVMFFVSLGATAFELRLLVGACMAKRRRPYATTPSEDTLDRPLLTTSPASSRHEWEQNTQTSVRKYEAYSRFRLFATTACALVALALLLLLTAILPNTWGHFNAAGIKSWAAVKRDKASGSLPEGKGDNTAFMRTMYKRVSSRLVLKFFPDCVIYYSFLAALVLLGFVSTASRRVARALQTRFPMPGPLEIKVTLPTLSAVCSRCFCVARIGRNRNWPSEQSRATTLTLVSIGGGCGSFGELVAMILFFITFALESRYWFYDHRYEAATEHKSEAEVLARGFGQLANICLGLLLFPVSRHSALSRAYGVAWEQVLTFHVWLGYATLVLFVAHAVSWWVVYKRQHLFPSDVLEVPSYFPTNGAGRAGGRCSDDWTVPLATIVVFSTLVLIGFLAHFQVRRTHFELFYFAHHIFLAVYATALWHAASAWYFMLGGLVYWVYDHALRATNAATRCRVVAFVPGPAETTHLELEVAGFAYGAGQYAFLMFPDLAPLVWHPFTISAAPTDAVRLGRLAFDIKRMPGDCLTAKLRGAALAGSQQRVALDGPHGVPADFDNNQAILLLAGGIGITPIHSIFREFVVQASDAYVSLCWVVRSADAFDMFPHSFHSLPSNFHVELFVTGPARHEEKEVPPLPYQCGRPKVANIVSSFVHRAAVKLKFVPAVFACGPTSMIQDASDAALFHGIRFHSEVFEF